MKHIALQSVKAVYGKIDSKKIDNTFEVIESIQILGLDFMIDSSLKVFLIEVNNNPCFDTSSNLLARIIP